MKFETLINKTEILSVVQVQEEAKKAAAKKASTPKARSNKIHSKLEQT